jgi:hypothetical protein
MSNKTLKTLFLLPAILFMSLPIQSFAEEWRTYCGRSHQESSECRLVKGDATLGGSSGVLYTIIFSDGDKRQYFYTGGGVCHYLEGLLVRKSNELWLHASAKCSKDNRLVFKLPSGETFFWINAFF